MSEGWLHLGLIRPELTEYCGERRKINHRSWLVSQGPSGKQAKAVQEAVRAQRVDARDTGGGLQALEGLGTGTEVSVDSNGEKLSNFLLVLSNKLDFPR